MHILLKGCLQYNRVSQERLYKLFYPELFKLCNKFFDEEHDIITALNNGMLNVFNNIQKYDVQKGDLFGWVYIIVRNAAISHIRSKKSKGKLTELTGDLHVEAIVNPFEKFEHVELIKALKTLNTNTRAVVNLFYIEGFMIKEIAILLQMKEGTIKWHLNEGRTRLKQFFSNQKISVYAN